MMESSIYKDLVTTRGLKYHYLVSHGEPSKPSLLLLHGFPSTSYLWQNQVPFFEKAGYTLIIPDLLGYGGSDKPTDHVLYKQSLMCADIVDILDVERAGKVIVIAHDWGCVTASRLANYYPERFNAFAFLAFGYVAPWPDLDYERLLVDLKQTVGSDVYGYWEFFAEDGADQLIETHLESFFSLVFAQDTGLWETNVAPRGALKEWLLADRKTSIAPYISEDERRAIMRTLLENRFSAPLCWYKVPVRGLFAEDDKKIPAEKATIKQPVFFGACKQDFVCKPEIQLRDAQKFCPNLDVMEFDTGHWVQLAVPNELNTALEDWIKRSVDI
ncbi:hypothetical protein CERSUDRAFT_121309 [Gelatoporia subvermispora B]|uniref:AB hydrolase-1 domain-containing protein n=1 Tax=Ceriporiopsis subvermispora (strain B) TaxID=914234 RepID=M2R849_CERS8|nr:hypothetical protein CERSUDRAFT_121309 [Gelatoporia subvermispora B]